MRLKFENLNVQGCGGGFVSGQLVCEVDKPYKCRGIDIKLIAVAHCSWSEGTEENRRHYSATVRLFKSKITVFGQPKGAPGPEYNHEAGVIAYDFCFAIPDGAPAAFHDHIGKVEYQLKGHCGVKAMLKRDPRHVAVLASIIGSENPAAVQRNSVALEVRNAKSFFMSRGQASARLQLASACLWPGCVVNGTVVVENKSSKSISKITFKLVQITLWHAQRNTNSVRRVIFKSTLPNSACSKGATHETTVQLQLPANAVDLLPSTTQGTGGVVTVQHFVELKCKVSMAKNLACSVPVFISLAPQQLQAIQKAKVMRTQRPKCIMPQYVHESLQAAVLESGITNAMVYVQQPVMMMVPVQPQPMPMQYMLPISTSASSSTTPQ